MRTLSASELLDVWEKGQSQHPLDRAITLLEKVCPEKSREELIRLNLGQRDALLFNLRKLFFGPRLDTYSECPICRTGLEISLNIEDILLRTYPVQATEHSASIGEICVSFKLPDSALLADCLNSSASPDSDYLLKSCMLSLTRKGNTIDFANISGDVREELAAKMAQLDPLSEVQINSTCSECGHQWNQTLDILSFLWTEIGAQATHLLEQVHILARAYSWRESDILSLSQWRRQYYLDKVTE
jgi:hypothetical protein